jgi:hypothetical protein
MLRRRTIGRREPLSPAWKHVLETGAIPPAELFHEGGDAVDLFRALHLRDDVLSAVWAEHRTTIWADWEASGRRGVCWGHWTFDLKLCPSVFSRLDEAGREAWASGSDDDDDDDEDEEP